MIPVDLLLHAYENAVFPMAMENGEIAWFSPDPRAIIPLDTFHIPHGLKRTLKKHPFEIRIDAGFEEVMRSCARRDETWEGCMGCRSEGLFSGSRCFTK